MQTDSVNAEAVATAVLEGGAAVRATAGKYLTFRLAEEAYGLQILKVQEIIAMMKVTHMPRSADYIRGVINLRGKIIPVLDLRVKFGMPAIDDTERTCIIVVQIVSQGVKITTGLIVDEVSEVINIAGEQIEPPPSFGASVNTAFVMGMGKVGQKVIILLDVDRVLAAQDVEALQQPEAV